MIMSSQEKHQTLGQLFSRLVMYYGDGGNPHYSIEDEGIIQTFNEAKAEFPVKFQFFEEQTNVMPPIKAGYRITKLDTEELRLWFLKWFGEV